MCAHALHPDCLRRGSGSLPQWADIYTLGGESRATTNPTALVFDCLVSVPVGELNIVTYAPQSLPHGARLIASDRCRA